MPLNWVHNFAHAVLLDRSSSDVTHNDNCTQCRNPERTKAAGDDDGAVNGGLFRMPLHYPRYAKSDYEKMEEWKVDVLLREYGLEFQGGLDEKRRFAMGAFLWPDQF